MGSNSAHCPLTHGSMSIFDTFISRGYMIKTETTQRLTVQELIQLSLGLWFGEGLKQNKTK